MLCDIYLRLTYEYHAFSYYLCKSFLLQTIVLQLSALLSEVGLNIREAHVFSTTDGFCLDVFVVDGWDTEVNLEHV